jgi:hypothetical protein
VSSSGDTKGESGKLATSLMVIQILISPSLL